jgi:predicted nucleic acid-binding Zn ribbon protein
MKKIENERSCMECGSALVGRVDKKYCDDECRVMYHNKNRLHRIPAYMAIHQVLRRNRIILEEFKKTQSKRKLGKKELIQKGYNFEYFTHQFQKNQFGVYDMVLIEESPNEYTVSEQ